MTGPSSHDPAPGDADLAARDLLRSALAGWSPGTGSPARGEGDLVLALLPADPSMQTGDAAVSSKLDELATVLLRWPDLRVLLGDVGAASREQADAAATPVSAEVRSAALQAFTASLEPLSCAQAEDRLPASFQEDAFQEVDAELLEVLRESETDVETGASALPTALRRAALAAFDRSVVGADAQAADAPRLRLPSTSEHFFSGRAFSGRRREAPLRARRPQPLLGRRSWVTAAAIALVFLGAGILFSRGGAEAEAGLHLTSLARVDRAGAMRMSQVQPRYFAELGRVFTPAEDELLAFGFGPASRLIAGSGDALRVARADEARRACPTSFPGTASIQGSVLMRLESGEVLLVTEDQPLCLMVEEAGVLVLLEGAAHVAVDAQGGPAVALPPGSEARFYPRAGGELHLSGPATGLLSAAGPQRFGEEARSLFDELKFFGGPLPRDVQETPISARTCGVRAGLVRKGRHDLQILAPVTDEPQDVHARLTWSPRPWLSDAHLVRVHLRAPAGTRVGLVWPDAATKAGEAQTEDERTSLRRTSLTVEPGIAVIELPLPAGWYERLDGRPLVFDFQVPAGRSPDGIAAGAAPEGRKPGRAEPVAWFDGLTLVLGASAPPSAGDALAEQGGAERND
jgi:hypothetical protein